jgi:hypothetical protein
MAKAPKPRGRPKKSVADDTSKPARGALIPISLKLPEAYFRILDTESAHLGIGRGDLLTLLLKRKRGELVLERPANAPRYKFHPEEFRTIKLYTWYVRGETRIQIDDDCLFMGQSSIAAWINNLLANWIGQPGGARPE